MRLTCVFTVSSPTCSRAASSGLDSPSASSRSTSVSRGVSTSNFPCVGAFGRSRANSAMSRRVIPGASSASPAATTRTASKSRSAVTSFSRNPLAPAASAS